MCFFSALLTSSFGICHSQAKSVSVQCSLSSLVSRCHDNASRLQLSHLSSSCSSTHKMRGMETQSVTLGIANEWKGNSLRTDRARKEGNVECLLQRCSHSPELYGHQCIKGRKNRISEPYSHYTAGFFDVEYSFRSNCISYVDQSTGLRLWQGSNSSEPNWRHPLLSIWGNREHWVFVFV